MLNKELLDKWLLRFRNLFRDHRSFINFKKIVYGFIAAYNINTLTAVVASLYLMARDYDRIDDYFKKGAFDLDQINQQMIKLIAEEAPLSKVNNRILLCGDATKIPKQAKKDPTVDKSYIQSESVNKRTGYVPASVYGCLSAVCEVRSTVFSMLLLARIVEHNEEIEAWQGRKRDPQTVRMIKDAVKVLKTMDLDAYIALDRYYLSSSLLDELENYNKNRASSEPALDAIMRAKVNCRVYEDHIADPNEAKRRGAPIKYDAYSIFDFFETRKDQFHELEIEIDGVKTTQQVYSQIIKWGRNKEKHELKFVLSQRGKEQIVLASTDLKLSDEEIIRIYDRRFTIEVSFRQGSELFGLFNSRFHTHCLEPFNFYASKEDPTPVSKISSEADKKKVLATVKATEGFALHAMLAMNLTRLYQCQAMKDPGKRKMYLRTYSQNFSLQETKQELSTAIICSLTRGEEKEINSLLSQPEPPVYSTKELLITDRGNKRIIRRSH